MVLSLLVNGGLFLLMGTISMRQKKLTAKARRRNEYYCISNM